MHKLKLPLIVLSLCLSLLTGCAGRPMTANPCPEFRVWKADEKREYASELDDLGKPEFAERFRLVARTLIDYDTVMRQCRAR